MVLADPASLPPLYATWLRDLLGGPLPVETVATCADCAMCAKPDDPTAGDPGRYFFDARVKCCTYLPVLPNFLVGRVLLDDDGPGRRSVTARMAAATARTPLGLGVSRGEVPAHASATRGFGQDLAHRCPHFVEDGGRCGIWRHRGAVCATYFCKHVRGAVGRRFWAAVHDLLDGLERDLARFCVVTLLGEGALDDHDPARAGWTGREREFYEASARLVDSLRWTDVLARCRPDVATQALRVRDAHAALADTSLPVALGAGRYVVTGETAATVRLESYSPTDPLDVPRPIVATLPCFDGRGTAAAVEAAARRGVPLTPSHLRILVDFGILAAPDDR